MRMNYLTFDDIYVNYLDFIIFQRYLILLFLNKTDHYKRNICNKIPIYFLLWL